MQESNRITCLVLICSLGAFLGVAVWFGIVVFLKRKWLSELEDILDDGVRFYSLNIFLATQGVLQYATVFLSRFHAKRYGMLEKREKIPKHIQRWFIFAFYWLMTSMALFACLFILMYLYPSPSSIRTAH